MGLGTIILVLLIGAIVLFAFGYVIWHKIKGIFKNKKK